MMQRIKESLASRGRCKDSFESLQTKSSRHAAVMILILMRVILEALSAVPSSLVLFHKYSLTIQDKSIPMLQAHTQEYSKVVRKPQLTVKMKNLSTIKMTWRKKRSKHQDCN